MKNGDDIRSKAHCVVKDNLMADDLSKYADWTTATIDGIPLRMLVPEMQKEQSKNSGWYFVKFGEMKQYAPAWLTNINGTMYLYQRGNNKWRIVEEYEYKPITNP